MHNLIGYFNTKPYIIEFDFLSIPNNIKKHNHIRINPVRCTGLEPVTLFCAF